MTIETILAPEDIRQMRAKNPKMRERNLARILRISEAELVAANCGLSITRIEPRVADFLAGMEAVGTVMALTRNEAPCMRKSASMRRRPSRHRARTRSCPVRISM